MRWLPLVAMLGALMLVGCKGESEKPKDDKKTPDKTTAAPQSAELDKEARLREEARQKEVDFQNSKKLASQLTESIKAKGGDNDFGGRGAPKATAVQVQWMAEGLGKAIRLKKREVLNILSMSRDGTPDGQMPSPKELASLSEGSKSQRQQALAGMAERHGAAAVIQAMLRKGMHKRPDGVHKINALLQGYINKIKKIKNPVTKVEAYRALHQLTGLTINGLEWAATMANVTDRALDAYASLQSQKLSPADRTSREQELSKKYKHVFGGKSAAETLDLLKQLHAERMRAKHK
jgi:hypothetical protein